ncbi:endonuclease domain-containing protein [Myxococcus sp. K15C18031901]|uniref:endonuclease domain-containing protein n=1 Tax=Myxococcus dinghuensis TaxID=2906761 RepID=UPI0020A7683E|nr:DUF559 domain-containing protein [Myxococcus dinghuensis]MCP3098065.1 endonuclease domain-containing protein [Myxococcus dinghuensis]
MSSPEDTALLDALDRHSRRRAQGIPTLTVLVGPSERALGLWTQWVQRQGLRVAVAEGDEPRAMVRAWATALSAERDLAGDAEAFVLQTQPARIRRTLHFQGKGTHERRVLLEGLTPPAGQTSAWELCRYLLELPAPTRDGALTDAVEHAIMRDPLEALRDLLTVVPDGRAPALRIPADFRALRAVATLATAAPRLTTVCVLTPQALTEHLRRTECTTLALLREGRLDVPEEPASSSAQARAETVSVDVTLKRLRQEGTPAPLLTRYEKAARAITGAQEESDQRARSEAESFLFDLLEHLPATRGHFQLNGVLDLGDGSRPLEVDLLCRELRLAIEIDGFHHFREPERYRRDRRKDLDLQRAGYWVARFLADDVVARLEVIRETVESMIAARRREATGQETPHGHR